MRRPAIPREVAALIGTVTAAALLVVGFSADGLVLAAQHHPRSLVVVMAMTAALQAVSLTGFASSVSVAGIGMLTAGFLLGTGAGAVAGVLAAAVHAAKKRPKPYKAVFNAAAFALASAAGTAVYEAVASSTGHGARELLAAEIAAAAFVVVNIGLLTLAMAASERVQPMRLWRERFAWLTPHYLAFGPVALVVTVAAGNIGAGGLAAAILLPLMLTVLVRESLVRIRARRGLRGAVGTS